MFYDVAMNFVIGTILMVAGAIMLCIPNRVFTMDLSCFHSVFICERSYFIYSFY